MKFQVFLVVALPALTALAAAGLVLMLKIERRSQRPTADTVANAVPMRPIAPAQIAMLKRRYLIAVLLVAAALGAFAFWLYRPL